MMKSCVSLSLCLLIATPLRAEEAGPDPETAPQITVQYVDESQAQLAAESKINQLLETKTVDFTVDRSSLKDVLFTIADGAGVVVNVDWPALELVGIDERTLVSYQAKQCSAAQALSDVLRIAGADCFDDDKPGHQASPGGVYISTLRTIKQHTVTRVYSVAPILREPYRPIGMLFSEDAFSDTIALHAWLRGERVYPFTDAMLLGLYKQHIKKMQEEIDRLDPEGVEDRLPNQKAGAGGGGGKVGIFAAEEEPDHADIQTHVDQLIDLIHRSVGDPDEWLDEQSMVEELDSKLIIRTTPSNHRQVSSLLNGLLQAEVDKQGRVLKDAHVSQWVSQANRLLKQGDATAAKFFIDKALRVMPEHVPARATKQVIDLLLEEHKPVG